MKTFFLIALFIATISLLKAQDDVEDCKDHPLFNRMPNYYLTNCEEEIGRAHV